MAHDWQYERGDRYLPLPARKGVGPISLCQSRLVLTQKLPWRGVKLQAAWIGSVKTESPPVQGLEIWEQPCAAMRSICLGGRDA